MTKRSTVVVLRAEVVSARKTLERAMSLERSADDAVGAALARQKIAQRDSRDAAGSVERALAALEAFLPAETVEPALAEPETAS